MAKAIVLIVLLLISPAAYAATHNVGGSGEWTATGDYVTWAAGENFTIGDTLVFTYGTAHAVDEVTEANFKSCNTASPLSTNSHSPTTISLNTTGTRYFICPTPNHCTGGQKLSITVVEAGATSPPAGSTPSTPAGSTPATPGTNPPPAPPSAAATLGGGDSLIVGLMSLVLVTVVGLN